MIPQTSILRISLNHLNDQIIGKKEYTDYLYHADAKIIFDTEPYRTESFAIGLLHHGKLEVSRDLITDVIQGPAFICMGPSVIRQWKKIDPEYLMEAVFLKKSFCFP